MWQTPSTAECPANCNFPPLCPRLAQLLKAVSIYHHFFSSWYHVWKQAKLNLFTGSLLRTKQTETVACSRVFVIPKPNCFGKLCMGSWKIDLNEHVWYNGNKPERGTSCAQNAKQSVWEKDIQIRFGQLSILNNQECSNGKCNLRKQLFSHYHKHKGTLDCLFK